MKRTNQAMLKVLRKLVKMWNDVNWTDQIPDCLNDEEVWKEAADIVRHAEEIPNIFEEDT